MPRPDILFLACSFALFPVESRGDQEILDPTLADKAAAPQAVDACAHDMHRLCDRFFPDARLVATCLVERRAELSRPCAEFLASPDAAADDDDTN